jgi:DNA invertase Pin-like site-specific DNA recombinase
MICGYARTSTAEQQAGLAAQERELRAAGAERLFSERVSSVAPTRPQLEAALDYVRDGDALMVSKLDRLARSTANLLEITARLESKGVALIVLSMAGGDRLDTRTPTGRLMLTLLGAIAEFERGIMLQRQREGIAAAKEAGKYKGRTPTAQRQGDVARAMAAEGVAPSEIAERLGISRMSVWRLTKGAAKGPSGDGSHILLNR